MAIIRTLLQIKKIAGGRITWYVRELGTMLAFESMLFEIKE